MAWFDRRRVAAALGAAFAVSGAAFAVFPQIDIGVSALFYEAGAGFPMAGSAHLEQFRDLVWNLSIIAFVLSVAGLGFAWAKRPVMGLSLRDCGYVMLLYLLGPILLVNGILKEHWGRARPADITEFGGARMFTPPLLPADQCATNCSFVSGEVSAAVVLAVVLLMLRTRLAGNLRGWGRNLWAFAAVGLPIATILQRIATGRHFLSDAVFAGILMMALALVLDWLMWRGERPVF